jgi:phosphatidylglycerophosphate synthase
MRPQASSITTNSGQQSREKAAAAVDRPSPALKANSLMVLGCIFAAATAGYLAAEALLSLGVNTVISAAIILLMIFGLVLNGLQYHGFQRLVFANMVTAIRAAIVSLVAATVFFPGAWHAIADHPWAFVTLVMAALAMDGLDGFLARRYGEESVLGARFDMEVDALLILCLATSAFLLGKAGVWVLLIGLMRYAFLLAQYPLPRLGAELPPSARRKLVCVVQVAVLCLILLPHIVPPVSSWLAGTALVLLFYSFAADCLYLLRRGEGEA